MKYYSMVLLLLLIAAYIVYLHINIRKLQKKQRGGDPVAFQGISESKVDNAWHTMLIITEY